MKENLEESIKFCLKSIEAIEAITGIINRSSDKHPDFSDELQGYILMAMAHCHNLNELLKEVIYTLNNRQQIFGTEGIEKRFFLEESDYEDN